MDTDADASNLPVADLELQAPRVDEEGVLIESIFASKSVSLPQKIEIVGAGYEPVNGKYSLSSDQLGRRVVCYTKIRDVVNDDASAQQMFVHKWSQSDHDEWVVSQKGPEKDFNYTLYTCQVNASKNLSCAVTLPPKAGWQLHHYNRAYEGTSKEPVPVLLYPDSPYLLDWRIDSKSDWTIVITSTCEGQALTTEFRFHRHVFEDGPNRCKYFKADFDKFSEHEKQVSEIELHHSAVEQMPVLLDFIYRGELRIYGENAIILMYLADYFACETMLEKVKTYCREALAMGCKDAVENWGFFYQQARDLEQSDITEMIETLCRISFDKLLAAEYYADLAADIPFEVWRQILANVKINKSNSEDASNLMDDIFHSHKDDLDYAVFKELTAKLKCVHSYAAHGLIMCELELMGEKPTQVKELTLLQNKCIGAVARTIGNGGSGGDEGKDNLKKVLLTNPLKGLRLIEKELELFFSADVPMIFATTVLQRVRKKLMRE